MANNLRTLRKARGLTQSEAASAIDTTLSQYAKLERGDRRLSSPWIERAAAAFEVDAGEIVASGPRMLETLGTLEADGAVRWLAGYPPVAGTAGQLAVAYGALGPLLDGAVLTTRCRRIEPAEMVDRRAYIVLTDRWLFRSVRTATRKGQWHLVGHNSPPSFDAAPTQVILVEAVLL